MTVAVDIDSTLYDFETPFRQAFLDLALDHGQKEEYFRGGYQSWVEWRSPADVCGWEAFSEALGVVHSEEIILTRQPYDHAPETLQEISKVHDIRYVTNRDPECFRPTYKWLENKGFPVGKLVCTFEDKDEYINDCQYLIDDRPRTLVEFVYSSGWKETQVEQRKAFGLMYPYNRALTDIPNVYLAPTWAGLDYYLKRQGVLNGERVL